MRHVYRVHGLCIRSEIELPILRGSSQALLSGEGDIEIRRGSVPRDLGPDALATSVFLVGDNDVLLGVPNVGRYLARGGRTLVVDAEAGADPGEVNIFLCGSGLAALLHQRGMLPLHASAVEKDGTTIAFLGESGAGKSTLAGMMVQRGWRLVCDDVLVVSRGAGGAFIAGAGAPVLKLWPDTLAIAGFADTQAPFASPEYRKHVVSTPDAATSGAPAPLRRILALGWQDGGTAAPAITPITPFDAMMVLRRHVYREELLAPLGHEQAFLRLASALIERAPVFRFDRTKDAARAEQTATMLDHHLAGLRG